MKPSTKTLFALGCAYAITTASSFAQLVYTFDEFGNSSGPSSAPPISPGILQPDPSGLDCPSPSWFTLSTSARNRRCGADRAGEPGRRPKLRRRPILEPNGHQLDPNYLLFGFSTNRIHPMLLRIPDCHRN